MTEGWSGCCGCLVWGEGAKGALAAEKTRSGFSGQRFSPEGGGRAGGFAAPCAGLRSAVGPAGRAPVCASPAAAVDLRAGPPPPPPPRSLMVALPRHPGPCGVGEPTRRCPSVSAEG